MGRAVLLTGATGFIGGEILAALADRPDPPDRIYALARARHADDLRRRAGETLFKLFQADEERTERARERVVWLHGDLTLPDLGLSQKTRDQLTDEVELVIHSAASTVFDLPDETARKINLHGALRVADLAERFATKGLLRRHLHISTAYVAGQRQGRILEGDLPGPEGPFGNSYERTKAAAERALGERRDRLPLTICRPSIVVGSSDTGRTYSFNVLYYPIKLIHRGQLPCVAGRPGTTLDIVPVDYVRDAVLALAELPEAEGKTYHLSASDDAIPIARFADHITGVFNAMRRDGNKPPLPVPKVIPPWRFRLYAWFQKQRLRGRAREQLEGMLLYLPYMTAEKVFDHREARAALGDRVPYPPVATYLDRVAKYAVTRGWGRNVSWDAGSLDLGGSREQIVSERT